ncbi:hypothetical protein G9A89_019845 [Geosiphon pyriformis]|nr:hypothetical protein G9A89_019845 [Geosiphon pyriformis]
MSIVRRLGRRREVAVDVHSEDEDDLEVEQGVLELSDLSGSEASFEDSDAESELSQSEGEEDTLEEISETKEEPPIIDVKNKSASSSGEKQPSQINIKKKINSPPEDGNTSLEISYKILQNKVTRKNGEAITFPNGILGLSKGDIPKSSRISVDDGSFDEDLDLPKTQSNGVPAILENKENIENDLNQEFISEKPLTAWQKKMIARQEYRKKLVEDPAFVPHLGEFWGHDDRFMADGLKNDFEKRRRRPQLPYAPRGKGVWGNSPPNGRWGHDGFEELMKLEEQEEKHKRESQRHFHNRRGYEPFTHNAPRRLANSFNNRQMPPPYPINPKRIPDRFLNNSPSSHNSDDNDKEKFSFPTTKSHNEEKLILGKEFLSDKATLTNVPQDNGPPKTNNNEREKNSEDSRKSSRTRNGINEYSGTPPTRHNNQNSWGKGFNSRGRPSGYDKKSNDWGSSSVNKNTHRFTDESGETKSNDWGSSHSRRNPPNRFSEEGGKNRLRLESKIRRYSDPRRRNFQHDNTVESVLEKDTCKQEVDKDNDTIQSEIYYSQPEEKDTILEKANNDIPIESNPLNEDDLIKTHINIGSSSSPSPHTQDLVLSTTQNELNVESQSDSNAQVIEPPNTKEETNNILESSDDEESDIEIIMEHQVILRQHGDGMDHTLNMDNSNGLIKAELVKVRISSPSSDEPIDFSHLKSELAAANKNSLATKAKSIEEKTPENPLPTPHPQSKRYSTRRIAVPSSSTSDLNMTSQATKPNDSLSQPINTRVTRVIPASAVYAAPFTPRTSVVSREPSNFNVVENEQKNDSHNSEYVEKETRLSLASGAKAPVEGSYAPQQPQPPDANLAGSSSPVGKRKGPWR